MNTLYHNTRSRVLCCAIFGALALAPAIAEESTAAAATAATAEKVGHFEPVTREMHGWTVHVDPQLIEGEGAEEGARALSMLANHLERIAILMPEKQLAEMRTMGIWIERQHPELSSMQYHPSRGWLVGRGYDPRLAKMVHIPRAASLVSRSQMLKHPAVILHELAHAYHDQILGFDDEGIMKAYKSAMEKGIYDNVLHHNGRMGRHYAATDHKEYFAEATEAYFYHNDFFPFVRAELRQHDPEAFAQMERIWGKVD